MIRKLRYIKDPSASCSQLGGVLLYIEFVMGVMKMENVIRDVFTKIVNMYAPINILAVARIYCNVFFKVEAILKFSMTKQSIQKLNPEQDL